MRGLLEGIKDFWNWSIGKRKKEEGIDLEDMDNETQKILKELKEDLEALKKKWDKLDEKNAGLFLMWFVSFPTKVKGEEKYLSWQGLEYSKYFRHIVAVPLSELKNSAEYYLRQTAQSG